MHWRTDNKGRLIYASTKWQNFSGLDIKTIEGDPCATIIHPDDLARVASEGAFCLALRRAYFGRFRHFTFGQWREVRVYSEPVFEHGIFRGYAGLTQPIAEERVIIPSRIIAVETIPPIRLDDARRPRILPP